MMQNTIADRGFMNMPLLRVLNIEAIIRTMPIVSIFQIAMKLKNIHFEMLFEFNDIRLVTLIRLEILPCFEKMFRRNDLLKKTAIDFHG